MDESAPSAHLDLAERDRTKPLAPELRREIQLAYLGEPNISKNALAKRFKVNPHTISRVLSGDDFEQLEAKVYGDLKAEARRMLQSGVKEAVHQWKTNAIPKAAKKGDHKAMSDLLKAVGVIEDQDQPRVVVQVGVKLTGHPE